MVWRALLDDFLSYGIPTILIGDPFQLPPVGGEEIMRDELLDFTLTEVVRQARKSPVLCAATAIREDRESEITWGTTARRGGTLSVYSTKALHGSKGRIADFRDMWFDPDTIRLCGKNATRIALNREYRKFHGYDGELPEVGETIICLKNNQKGKCG